MPNIAAPVQKARNQMYEELILDTAESIFAKMGVEQCQAKDVASAAGISLSTQYKYFPSKEDLLRGVHARRLHVLMQLIIETVETKSDPLAEMLSANAAYLRFHMNYPTYLAMHLREGVAWFESQKFRCQEQRDALEEGMMRASSSFARGIKKGLFVKDPPLLMARAAVAANQVHLSHWMAEGMTDSKEEVVKRAHAHFIRAFCRPEKVQSLLAERLDG
jgi:AcrR family transcriptional regulator